MKIFEASKNVDGGKEYALGVVSVMRGGDTIESEAPKIKEALVGWHQRHGKECRKLDLIFTADEAQHPHILEYIEAVLNFDDFIAEFKKQLIVGLTFITPTGKLCKEFTLGGK